MKLPRNRPSWLPRYLWCLALKLEQHYGIKRQRIAREIRAQAAHRGRAKA